MHKFMLEFFSYQDIPLHEFNVLQMSYQLIFPKLLSLGILPYMPFNAYSNYVNCLFTICQSCAAFFNDIAIHD